MRYYASKSREVSELERKHADIVRKLAGECMVVLENEGILPLKECMGSLALYGMGARRTVKGGTGSGDVNSRYIVSIEQGLKESGFEISSSVWLDECDKIYEKAFDQYAEYISAQAKKNNTSLIEEELSYPFFRPSEPLIEERQLTDDRKLAIYVISRDSGEGSDRKCEKGDYYLYDVEEKNLKTLSASYKNADVLNGKTIPSGKLTGTWAKKYSDYCSYDTFSYQNENRDDEFYQEGIYVGYRYFDLKNIEPAYCFGYGKGYTDFLIEDMCCKYDNEQVSFSAGKLS